MIIKSTLIHLFTLTVLLFSGCSGVTKPDSPKLTPIAFTQQLRNDYRLCVDDLERLQFYNSDTIVLQRRSACSNRSVESGVLVTKNKDDLESVVIKPMTPGVLVKTEPNALYISFEDGSQIKFTAPSKSCCDQKGYYKLAASSWKNGVGIVTFEGKKYHTLNNSAKVYLMIDKKTLIANKTDERIVKGRVLN